MLNAQCPMLNAQGPRTKNQGPAPRTKHQAPRTKRRGQANNSRTESGQPARLPARGLQRPAEEGRHRRRHAHPRVDSHHRVRAESRCGLCRARVAPRASEGRAESRDEPAPRGRAARGDRGPTGHLRRGLRRAAGRGGRQQRARGQPRAPREPAVSSRGGEERRRRSPSALPRSPTSMSTTHSAPPTARTPRSKRSSGSSRKRAPGC